jgi:hypothetical protein
MPHKIYRSQGIAQEFEVDRIEMTPKRILFTSVKFLGHLNPLIPQPAAKVRFPPLVPNAALAYGVRFRPFCMYRLLFAIDILARSRKSLICIRPVDRHAGRGHIGVTLAPWSH